MLLLKKKIIFLNIVEKYGNIIKYSGLVYHFIKSKLIGLVYFCNCSLQKRSVIIFDLSYFYSLKFDSFSPHVFQVKLNRLAEIFSYFQNFSNLRNLVSSKYSISVLRSPFVYKKSMEQFFYKTYKINYQTGILKYNFFLEKYYQYFLNKEFASRVILKLVFKTTFFWYKNEA